MLSQKTRTFGLRIIMKKQSTLNIHVFILHAVKSRLHDFDLRSSGLCIFVCPGDASELEVSWSDTVVFFSTIMTSTD